LEHGGCIYYSDVKLLKVSGTQVPLIKSHRLIKLEQWVIFRKSMRILGLWDASTDPLIKALISGWSRRKFLLPLALGS
jgi:hypothetical protein